MTGEFSHSNDINETKIHQPENFQNIKPETEITKGQADDIWKSAFNDVGTISGRLDNMENNNRRELTPNEKMELSNRTGWSEDKIDYLKCKLDNNNVVHIDTINSKLDGKTSENGVPFERKLVDINGVRVEGVFPKFNSQYDTYLPADKITSGSFADICNKNLKNEIENNSEFANKFTPERRLQIEEGHTPDGYVWHHNEEVGKMQLVSQEDHEGAKHTGGNTLWGNRAKSMQEGVHF